MNPKETTPDLTESLIETIQDKFVNTDEMAHRSEYLRMQYENASPDMKNAMDVVMVCLTDKTIKAIMSINEAINKSNANVG